MTSGFRTHLFASAAFFGLAVCTPAQAQTQEQPSPPQNERVSDDNQQAIIVTAQKREQVLLEVPQSVTVVGGDTLERENATNFQDYLSLVPGFSLEQDQAGESRITLRGANTGGVASTVAVFMDEVPFGSSTGLANGAILSGDFDPFDLARIEVLRGPQGTLYGASSFGGVLKYVTNSPRLDRFEVRGKAGFESTKGGGLGHNAAAVLNAPLGDKAAVRVSAFVRKEPGYVNSIGNNPLFSVGELIPGFPDPPRPVFEIGSTLVEDDINERKTYGGRASILFQPVDTVSVRLTAFAQNLNAGGSSFFEVDPDTLDPLYGGLVQSLYSPEPTRIKYRVYSGTVDWDLGFANLFSSTAYSTFSEKFERDFNFAFAPLVNFLAANPDIAALAGLQITDAPLGHPVGVQLFQTTATDKFTQEFRLSSPNNDTIEWLIGAFYTHEKSAIDPQNIFATEFGTNNPDPDVDPLAEIFLRSKYKEYAAFANATWHITPRLDLTAGGRLAHNKQHANLLISGPLAGSQEIPDLNSDETVFTYSVAPRFEVNDHTSVYARVATGYRPGGPNVIPPDSDVPLTYDADRLTSWEVGLKTEAPDRLWSLEAAAYHLKWKDIQLFAIVNDIGINANGGRARINGVELSGTLRPVHGLRILANGAYTDSKLLDDTPNPEVTGGRAGDPLPYVPKWSAALHADYEFPLSGSLTGAVGGTVNRVGRRGINLDEVDANNDVIRIPGYTEVDLRAGISVDRWSVQAYVQNLFDKDGITSASGFDGATFPNGAAGVAIIRPRTFGLSVTANFRK